MVRPWGEYKLWSNLWFKEDDLDLLGSFQRTYAFPSLRDAGKSTVEEIYQVKRGEVKIGGGEGEGKGQFIFLRFVKLKGWNNPQKVG